MADKFTPEDFKETADTIRDHANSPDLGAVMSNRLNPILGALNEAADNVVPMPAKELHPGLALAELLGVIPHNMNMVALAIERFPDEHLQSADAQLRKTFESAGFVMQRISRLYGWTFHFDPIPSPDDRVLRSRMYPKMLQE